MVRPQSIVWFERFYLGNIVLGLISSVVNWGLMKEQFLANPALTPDVTDTVLPAVVAGGFLLNLVLWYFVARRRSVVAKWIIVVLFVVGLFSLLSVFTGAVPASILPFTILSFLLSAAAIYMMFRPDTKPWFSRDGDLGDTFS